MAEDSITLGGQTYLIRGQPAVKSISEFTVGLKIGQASYDDRAHAFYLSLDDFSGGFGHRTLDVREALGTHYDNPGGVDLRRARHVTLGPLVLQVDGPQPGVAPKLVSGALTGAIALTNLDQTTLFPTNDYMYFGLGNELYRQGSNRTSIAKVVNLEYVGATRKMEYVTRIIHWTSSDDTRRMFVFGINAAGNPIYVHSADPGASSPTFAPANKTIFDALPWEDKIIGQTATGFGIVYTTDGTNWNDDGAVDTEPHWRANGLIRFIGEAEAPWDATALYFLDAGKLYVLDFYKYKAWKIPIGDHKYLNSGIIWNGIVLVTDGWSAWMYNPRAGGETVREIPLYGRDGVPDSLRTGRYRIQGFVDGGPTLYAIAERTADMTLGETSGFIVLAYNGVGWSQYGPKFEGVNNTGAFNPFAAIVDRFPMGLDDASAPSSRVLHVLCQRYGWVTSEDHITDYQFFLPKMGEIPIDGTDLFQSTAGSAGASNGPAPFLTGWIDGGFRDLAGVLHYIKVDLVSRTGLGSGSSVKVEYRLDNDETSGWTNLGSVISSSADDILWFDDTNKAGVTFTTVQFRVTLTGVAGLTRTPELRALTLVYNKRSPLRQAWVVRIDVSRMIEQKKDIDGSFATLLNVWEKLKAVWNTQTLVKLVVPNVEPSANNLRVQIADFTMPFDDFRDEVTGRGWIDLTLIEPVSPT